MGCSPQKKVRTGSVEAITCPGYSNLRIPATVSETEDKARRLATSRNLAKLKTTLGRPEGIPSVETALAYPYTMDELAYIHQFSQSYIDGDPQQIKARLETISRLYQTTDLGIVTICHEFADRVRSYELVAEVCGLKPQDTAP
jgi:alkanesulfonate monooxygenase SsuD/methylene tetrahydromethanopterin reductase-like flavin-dependent oxidoreductase (luciferase family)